MICNVFIKSFIIIFINFQGRSMIATKPFRAGDTIFEEEPFVSCQFSWNVAYGYLACDHCMRPLETAQLNVQRLTNDPSIVLPLPEHCPTKEWLPHITFCPQCGVKYCSEECRVESLKKYHTVCCLGVRKNDETHPINILNDKWK